MESNKTFWIIMIVVVSSLITMLTASRPISSPKAPKDSISPSNMFTLKKNLKQSSLSPKIITICKKTDYPALCESSIKPLITAKFKPDVSSVLTLSIQASITATKAALSTVGKSAAAECKELYDEAAANLEGAITALKASDNPTVNSDLSAGMTYYSTCNDGFEEAGKPNPFAGVSENLRMMVSNCLAISTLIE